MMDISVSRLNQRMALQLPSEFPLGLVFVVGRVNGLAQSGEDGSRPSFLLVEDGYQLRCRLSDRTAEESALADGDSIRAGGHLAFDPHRAAYFLYVRDVEVLSEEPPPARPAPASLGPILEDIRRRSQAANLIPADLPSWVRRMAPPEIQPDLELPDEELEPAEQPEATPMAAEMSDEVPGLAPAPEAEGPVKLTDELIAFLSEAMDSPEDVELTPELMAELAPEIGTQPGQLEAGRTAAETPAETEARIPWVVAVLIFLVLIIFFGALFVLTINLTGGG